MAGLTNILDIEKAYAEICDRELQLEEELQQLSDGHGRLVCSVESLQKVLPNLKLLESDSGQLENKVSFTSTLAEGVSSKVRKLDVAKSRVSACLERVQDLLDLQQCTDGVQAAMLNDELEQAAAHVHRFRSLDQNLLRVTAQFQDSASLENSVRLLLEAETKLKALVNSRFDAAVHQGDRASVERFFKIFPLLGLTEEGAAKFSKYLSAQISADSEKLLARALGTAKTQRAGVKYADALTVLFEEIAQVVETHQPIFETYYGPGCLFVLLKHLQKECDRQARKIIEEFEQERRFSEKAKVVLACLTSSSSSTQRPEPRDLDLLLGEVVLLSTRADLYFRFFRRRVTADLETLNLDEEKKAERMSEVENFIRSCELSSLVHDIIGRYITVEEYFMREMCAKAVAMDTSDGESLTSSMIDDTFFIIRKSLR